jgi:hypothetical protein
METEEATRLEAVTRRQPMKIQQTEGCSELQSGELATALWLLVVTICKSSINHAYM